MDKDQMERIERTAEKIEIQEVIYQLARGIDRCDEEVLKNCYHEGATDDHGQFKGTAEEFITWVIPVLKTMEATQHCICNILINLDGEKAKTESYFLAFHRLNIKEVDSDMVAAGRYLDSFEKKDGVWAITHRHAVFDWNRLDPSTDTWNKGPAKEELERGARAPLDPSYSS